MTHSDRVFMRLIGLPLQRRLLPALFALLVGVGLADPMIDWGFLREQLRAQATASSAMQLALLASVWSLLGAAALAPAWRHASARLLLRQPLSALAWTRYLLPSLVPALIPIALLWWLYPIDSATALVALCACASAMILVASQGFVHSVLVSLGGSALLFGLLVLWCSPAHPLARLGTAFAALALVPAACKCLRTRGTETARVDSGARRAATPMRALLSRDLLCLRRQAPAQLRQLLVLAGVASAFLVGLRVNGDFPGRDLFRAACILQMLSLMSLYDILTRLRRGLGDQFTRRHWPVAQTVRARSLLALCAVLALPSVAALSLTGYSMGLTWLALLWLYLLGVLTAQCALFATSAARPAAHGWSMWVWLLGALLTCALPPVLASALALGCTAFAWAVLRRSMDGIAEDIALGKWERSPP